MNLIGLVDLSFGISRKKKRIVIFTKLTRLYLSTYQVRSPCEQYAINTDSQRFRWYLNGWIEHRMIMNSLKVNQGCQFLFQRKFNVILIINFYLREHSRHQSNSNERWYVSIFYYLIWKKKQNWDWSPYILLFIISDQQIKIEEIDGWFTLFNLVSRHRWIVPLAISDHHDSCPYNVPELSVENLYCPPFLEQSSQSGSWKIQNNHTWSYINILEIMRTGLMNCKVLIGVESHFTKCIQISTDFFSVKMIFFITSHQLVNSIIFELILNCQMDWCHLEIRCQLAMVVLHQVSNSCLKENVFFSKKFNYWWLLICDHMDMTNTLPLFSLIICWLRFPNPRAVIISLLRNGARMARGIFTARDEINTEPSDLAGPP